MTSLDILKKNARTCVVQFFKRTPQGTMDQALGAVDDYVYSFSEDTLLTIAEQQHPILMSPKVVMMFDDNPSDVARQNIYSEIESDIKENIEVLRKQARHERRTFNGEEGYVTVSLKSNSVRFVEASQDPPFSRNNRFVEPDVFIDPTLFL